jgi:hypothetical protein
MIKIPIVKSFGGIDLAVVYESDKNIYHEIEKTMKVSRCRFHKSENVIHQNKDWYSFKVLLKEQQQVVSGENLVFVLLS